MDFNSKITFNTENKAPNVKINIDYIYGFRCSKEHRNLIRFLDDERIVYVQSKIIILFNQAENI